MAAAIGYGLIEQGVRVHHGATTALVQHLQLARQRLCLEQALQKLDRYRVLILDDIGYVKKTDQETQVLFELIAHRYETGSLIVTSNQPFVEWDRIFPDHMMTVAAVDRLIHHATIIEIGGDSYRRKEAMMQKQTLTSTTITPDAATITPDAATITPDAATITSAPATTTLTEMGRPASESHRAQQPEG